ncbi:hypothetical protein IEQ44_11035 [Nocardioides sp. Y6]|uniref:SLATT domain-containing protein n=1 Tax=Nocardioides malaquae TaxID=2773426 RepID=A0ABR9RUB4_9ACTN|nr:hypothetical protein [Nocardioides malaquae]MBE7325189.1 hypothetical protein [Nocardioides malaquae]
MAAEHHPQVTAFGRRVEKWVRDSAELRAWLQQTRGLGVPATPEEAALRRYQQSRRKEVALPHPSVTPARYEALQARHREVNRRLALAVLLIPAVVLLAIAVNPMAAQLTVAALVLPLLGLAAHDSRLLSRLTEERHLSLSGGLADAWGDWVRVRTELEALDHASQARAALSINEARMQALVMTLARAEARPGHRDTEEHAASRQWVYRTAAKAVALAEAERELEAATQRHLDAGDLQMAPDGDPAALDDALHATREITRGMEPPRLG